MPKKETVITSKRSVRREKKAIKSLKTIKAREGSKRLWGNSKGFNCDRKGKKHVREVEARVTPRERPGSMRWSMTMGRKAEKEGARRKKTNPENNV